MRDRLTFFPDRSTTISIDRLPNYASALWINTEDSEKIQALYFKHPDTAKNLVLYFHGNAGNLYHRVPQAEKLFEMGVDVLLISYRGYAQSTGSPSEAGIYMDGAAAFTYATDKLRYPEEDIILLGRSLGSTVAVHLGQNRQFKKVILITPLTSGREMAVSMGLGWLKFMAGNSYNSLEKINNLTCPILIIHGDKDEVVPYYMGEKLYQEYQGPKKLVTITGGRHNDLEQLDYKLFWGEIGKFLKDSRE